MPVQSNFAIQNQPRVVWTGTAARAFSIRKFVGFAFAFEVTAAIAVDAVFNIQAAPASDADPCVPGTFADIPGIATCEGGAVGTQSTITIPAGQEIGSVCSGTIPCRSGTFIRLVAVSGTTANVLGAAVLHGPKI